MLKKAGRVFSLRDLYLEIMDERKERQQIAEDVKNDLKKKELKKKNGLKDKKVRFF